jgi:hypothetical protein
MKLFNVPSKRWIRVKETGDELFFDHIDGMYSFCLHDGNPDKIVHLKAWTDVEIIDKPKHIQENGR